MGDFGLYAEEVSSAPPVHQTLYYYAICQHRGLQLAGSGTCHNALVTSVARAHWDATEPVRHSWDARKKAKAGKLPKKIVLASEGYTPPLAAYEHKKTT